MKRSLRFLPALFFALTLAACDSSDPYEGNAGVYSFPITFDVNGASLNENVLSEQFDVPDITQNVVNNGAVLVYFEEQGTWTAMPYTYGVESATEPLVDYTVTLGYAYDTRLLEVFYETSADPDVLDLPGSVDMKVVIIDSIPVGKNAIDLRDYEAVKQYYGLED
jgi:hypothetical protein